MLKLRAPTRNAWSSQLRERTKAFMTIRIITLEREYGSGGGVIAGKVTTRLGWKLWDQLLTDEIARRLDCARGAVEDHEERRDPVYYRLLKAFMRGSFEGSLNAPRLKVVDTESTGLQGGAST